MSQAVVAKLGVCTPLGLTTRATQCAIAAGLACFSETRVIGGDGEPIKAAWLRAPDAGATRLERVLFFAERALRECLEGVDATAFSRIPVLLALPERDQGGPLVAGDVAIGLARTAPGEPSLDWSARAFAAGRAGYFIALETALGWIAQGTASAVLIGGADSYCDEASLRQRDEAGRNASDDNFDGLIPGEGAGFTLIAEAAAARRAQLHALAAVETCQIADDVPFAARVPALAPGLTELFHKLARARSSAARVDAIFSCQSGEGLWARELSVAQVRNVSLVPEPQRRFVIAEALGDVGAAAAPIQVARLVNFRGDDRARTFHIDRAVLYGAADGGTTGGCILSLPPQVNTTRPAHR